MARHLEYSVDLNIDATWDCAFLRLAFRNRPPRAFDVKSPVFGTVLQQSCNALGRCMIALGLLTGANHARMARPFFLAGDDCRRIYPSLRLLISFRSSR
jgi:hypothetical protein